MLVFAGITHNHTVRPASIGGGAPPRGHRDSWRCRASETGSRAARRATGMRCPPTGAPRRTPLMHPTDKHCRGTTEAAQAAATPPAPARPHARPLADCYAFGETARRSRRSPPERPGSSPSPSRHRRAPPQPGGDTANHSSTGAAHRPNRRRRQPPPGAQARASPRQGVTAHAQKRPPGAAQVGEGVVEHAVCARRCAAVTYLSSAFIYPAPSRTGADDPAHLVDDEHGSAGGRTPLRVAAPHRRAFQGGCSRSHRFGQVVDRMQVEGLERMVRMRRDEHDRGRAHRLSSAASCIPSRPGACGCRAAPRRIPPRRARRAPGRCRPPRRRPSRRAIGTPRRGCAGAAAASPRRRPRARAAGRRSSGVPQRQHDARARKTSPPGPGLELRRDVVHQVQALAHVAQGHAGTWARRRAVETGCRCWRRPGRAGPACASRITPPPARARRRGAPRSRPAAAAAAAHAGRTAAGRGPKVTQPLAEAGSANDPRCSAARVPLTERDRGAGLG